MSRSVLPLKEPMMPAEPLHEGTKRGRQPTDPTVVTVDCESDAQPFRRRKSGPRELRAGRAKNMGSQNSAQRSGGNRARRNWKQQAETLQRQLESAHQHLEEKDELLEEKDELLEKKDRRIAELDQTVLRYCDENQELAANLARTSVDLRNLRVFAAESAPDVEAFIALFDELNDRIGELSDSLLDNLEVFDKTMENIDLDALRRAPGGAFGDIEELIQSGQEWKRPTEATLILAVRALFVRTLWDTIFKPFSPGLDTAKSAIMKDFETRVQMLEPHQHYAHFRAMAYKTAAATRSVTFVAEVGYELVKVLGNFLTVFCWPPHPAIVEWAAGPEVKETIAMALRWQDQAYTAHLAFDYRPLYMCRASELRADQVQRQRLPRGRRPGAEQHENLARGVAVTFGLEASRSGCDYTLGSASRQVKVLRKARVL